MYDSDIYENTLYILHAKAIWIKLRDITIFNDATYIISYQADESAPLFHFV